MWGVAKLKFGSQIFQKNVDGVAELKNVGALGRSARKKRSVNNCILMCYSAAQTERPYAFFSSATSTRYNSRCAAAILTTGYLDRSVLSARRPGPVQARGADF